MSTHPDRRPSIRPCVRASAVAEHRGRLRELAELRTLTEIIREDGRSLTASPKLCATVNAR